MLRQKLSQEERRTRSHRLIVRGAVFESIVPEAKTMTDEEAADLLRLALTGEEAQAYLKKRAEDGTPDKALWNKGRPYSPGRVRSAESLSPHGRFPRATIWRLCLQQVHLAPLQLSYTPTKTVPAVGVCHFAGFIIPIREVIPIAIYHWNIGIVSRGKGKSAVAMTATEAAKS